MNLVIDTNVYVSAVLSPKSPVRKMVDECLNQHTIFFSHETHQELLTVFARPVFDRVATPKTRQAFIEKIFASNVSFAQPKRIISASIDDSDNRFLEVAIECNADYLITGDKKHLLPLHPFQDIAIVEPRQFVSGSRE